MRVGITGHTGFIGTLLHQTLKTCSRVTSCEPFDRGKYDLLDVKSMKTFVKDKDVLFHLAGRVRTTNEDMVSINTLGTLNLLEAIRSCSKKDTKVVFASSLQVYPHTDNLVLLKESHHLQPDNVFGLSKKFAEELILKYHEDYGLRYLIYRISNVYGPGCRPYFNSVISTFIDLISKNKSIPIYNRGKEARDFIYVNDVVAAFVKSLKYPRSDVFNICTSVSTNVNELVSLLEKIMGVKSKRKYIKTSANGDYLVGNSSKALVKLNFRYKTCLEDGLKATVAHHRLSR